MGFKRAILVAVINLLLLSKLVESVEKKDVETAVKEVEVRIQEMKNAGLVDDSKIDQKLVELGKNMAGLKTAKPAEKEKEDKTVKTTTAITNAVNGIPELVNGIQTRDYKRSVIGGMKIVSSILTLFAPGVVTVANLILNALSNLHSLFTGTKVKEIKSPWKSALDQFKLENLQDDVADIEYLWSLVTKSVVHFEDFLNTQQVITEELASQFYAISFQKVGIFGKLERSIQRYCVEEAHSDNKGDKNDVIHACMGLVVSYARLASSRVMLLTRMAGITQRAEFYFEGIVKGDSPNKEKLVRKQQSMGQYKENFIYLAKQQRNADKDVLRFIVDPMNQFRSKRVIHELLSNPQKFPILMQYLLSLDEEFGFLIDNNAVVLCPDSQLGGLCTKMEVSTSGKYQKWESTDVKIMSWFVPAGLQVSMKDTDNKEYGPFIGSLSYSPTSIATLNQFLVEKMVGELSDSSENLVLCNTVGMCDTIDYGKRGEIKLQSYHGIDFSTLQSIHVPDGLKVNLLKYEDNKKDVKKRNGPLVGPFKQVGINSGCFSGWSHIKVEKADDKDDGKKMVEACNIDNGFCTQVEPGKMIDAKEDQVFFVGWFSSDTVDCRPLAKDGLLDIRIPLGRQIKITQNKAVLGPFTGPAFYPQLNINSKSIQVDNLWIDNKGKRSEKRVFSGNPHPYFNRSFALDEYPSQHHHHHHHHHHRPDPEKSDSSDSDQDVRN